MLRPVPCLEAVVARRPSQVTTAPKRRVAHRPLYRLASAGSPDAMESTTSTLARTAPLDGLAELVEQPGPALTVVLESDPGIENAAQRSELRWRGQRDEALARGVPEAALAGVDRLVAEAHLGGPARFVVVDGETGDVRFDEHLAAVPDTGPLVRWGPYPSLVPLLADRQARIPHVVVRCDQEGADLLAVDADGRATGDTVSDDGHPYRHARSVGWEERRAWDRARRHREQTAEEIVAAVAAAASTIAADLVVVAGDERTVDRVVERAAARGLDARAVRGGRGADGSAGAVDDAVDTVVRTAAAEHVVEALQRFRERLAHGLAVDGDHAVSTALAAGQVDVLVVHDGDAARAVVDDAIVTALRTSSAVLVVPDHAGPESGVGAFLRWR